MTARLKWHFTQTLQDFNIHEFNFSLSNEQYLSNKLTICSVHETRKKRKRNRHFWIVHIVYARIALFIYIAVVWPSLDAITLIPNEQSPSYMCGKHPCNSANVNVFMLNTSQLWIGRRCDDGEHVLKYVPERNCCGFAAESLLLSHIVNSLKWVLCQLTRVKGLNVLIN